MDKAVNLLTVDCEEWFVAEALASHHSRDEWDRLTSTVVKNSRRLLDMFYHYDVKATWFILGWVAERHQDLLQEIANEGHEIACHSYYHRRVDMMTPDEFRMDTRRAVSAIIQATGNMPFGFRAPSWSINTNVTWAFEILAELGFIYDSSVFPIKHDIYGVPHGPRHTFKMKIDNDKTLYEIPASTYRLFGKNIPVAGGGYLRHSPYWYTRQVIRSLNKRGRPALVYIHPWELDPDPPRVEGLSAVQKFRTYGSTSLLTHKLNSILRDFQFTTMIEYLDGFRQQQIGFR
jgi:polysaccharide deacetylase family protein (PEP-CTERM system associated)